MSTVLARTTFETSRAAEYFTPHELQAQTGQPASRFVEVVIKELLDNALDAAETAGARPIIALDVTYNNDDVTEIRVRDNGPGIPPETVQRILDFSTRTSDKAAYRAPTRGAQGNALKTVLGIGTQDGVVIEARGVRHRIRAWTDPAGEVRINHTVESCRRTRGTAVIVSVPVVGEVDADRWAREFALVNPHAKVKIHVRRMGVQGAKSPADEMRDSYRPVSAGGWAKWTPADPTAPAWYDHAALERLIFAHIADARRGGRDLTVRDFVRQFRGLTGSAKAKAVADQVQVHRLSEIEDRPDTVRVLLDAMQSEARPPKPSTLGAIGEEALRSRLDDWHGVKRHWYRRTKGEVDGVPFIFEVLVAETSVDGDLYHAINHSPTFNDPLSGNDLECREFTASSAHDFLRRAHATPGSFVGPKITAAIHLVSPSLTFLDRGKTRVTLPDEMADAIADTMWRATAELYQEGRRRERDAARQERQDIERSRESRGDEITLKDAVHTVLPAAFAFATGDGALPVGSRSLWYVVRKRVQEHTDRDLNYDYFSQALLPEYQSEYGELDGLYYDPRGVLYEPHTGREVPLGTREVDDYDIPEFVYDKMLYVEKKGLWPVLKAARIAERFDMAVIVGEGYANVATRSLLAAAADGHDVRVFVLHDADPAGYEIARTLSEATRRMPGHHVEVHDLGLRVEGALELGLEPEEFTRRKALPSALDLNDVEREFFTGRRVGKHHVARRIELNAFAPPALIDYIEFELSAAGATKLIPPRPILIEQARETLSDQVLMHVKDSIARQIGTEAIAERLTEQLAGTVNMRDARNWIDAAFAEDLTLSWSDAIRDRLRDHVAGSKDAVDAAVRAALDAI
jgi:DNA topoisomerase VI subunit B